MNKNMVSILFLIVASTACIHARAETPDARWSISAGAKSRFLDCNFDSEGFENWPSVVTPLQRRGSSRLADGSEGVQYEDGAVSAFRPYDGPGRASYRDGTLRRVEPPDNGVVEFRSTS